MRILYRKIQHLNRRIQRKKTGIPGRRPFPRPERRHLHGYRRCLPRGCRSAGNGRKPESDRHLHPFLLRHRGILFRAAPYVIGQMKEEQSLNIDALSGATYSSNGIIHATANALEIPEDEYAPRPGRDLAHKQKEHGHIVKHTIESQEQYEEKVKEYEDAQN